MDHPDSGYQDRSGTARQAIAEALRRVDLLRDPEGHRMCVEFFEEEIGEAILHPDAAGTWIHADDVALLGLVDQLLSRDVAMWVFVYTISDIYGPSEIAESVREAVHSHLAEPLLTRAQRRDLHRLCSSIAGLNVPQLFKLSVDHIGFTLRSDPANLRAVLNELEELPARNKDGLHPIIVFVEYLASEQPPESGDQLRAWVDEYIGTRTPHVTALRSIRNESRTEHQPEPGYCVIHLDAGGLGDGRFSMSVYFQEGDNILEPLLPADNATYTEDEVRARIGEALNRRQLAGIRPADLRIEFILPVLLINLPVDQWRVSLAQIALGVQYQVVVRSLTRLRDLAVSHMYWHQKWAVVPDAALGASWAPGTGPGETAGQWLTEEAAERDPEQVFVRLSMDGGPVCLLLADAPEPDRCQALLLALTAGIPVLMWSRHPEPDLKRGVTELLADVSPLRLSDLPRRLLDYRRGAALRGVPDDHIARHLTLLYDDADRIPAVDGVLRTPI